MAGWEAIMQKLPCGMDMEGRAKRDEMFKLFDPNDNRILSLAEVDKGVRDILKIDEIFDCKPAIMRAFQAAKSVAPIRSKYSEDFVTRSEFRVLLIYLAKYFELFQLFSLVDGPGDRRIDLAELTEAVPKLQEAGISIEDPEAAFQEMDVNGGGQILFNEFCDWALNQHIKGHLDDYTYPIPKSLVESGFPQSELQKLREDFSRFDENQDGQLNVDEFRLIMAARGKRYTPAELKARLGRYDANASGNISWQEFIDYTSREKFEQPTQEQLVAAFKFFDKDGSGFIDANELKEACVNSGHKMTPEEAQRMIQKADVNKDGKLNYAEFAKYLIGKEGTSHTAADYKGGMMGVAGGKLASNAHSGR
eukprot:NODE_565_length_1349_cov_589.576154_g440_i0.p1 GENE.NODE_565_length_1349_cov_589.576154_g440_i0~~NODE_565_length_1349_cov_589.576154_g440_i0.p1  ORF type:complete len:364 (-),score=92.37 NODE_565_length_1349_cov_589.576154_g440_i0:162-1253(-)